MGISDLICTDRFIRVKQARRIWKKNIFIWSIHIEILYFYGKKKREEREKQRDGLEMIWRRKRSRIVYHRPIHVTPLADIPFSFRFLRILHYWITIHFSIVVTRAAKTIRVRPRYRGWDLLAIISPMRASANDSDTGMKALQN